VKTINIKALYSFEGYVVEEIKCEESCAQVKLRFDKRIPPKCPRCQCVLPKNKIGKSCVMDSPLAHLNTVWILFPTVQGRCSRCEYFVTTRPKEFHPTKEATWRYMRLISSWADIAPANRVAEIFHISATSVRSYDKAVLEHDTPPPDLDGIRALLVDEKSVRKKHNYVTVVLNADTGELLHMHEGKKGESLSIFLRSLSKEQKVSIEAVGMDRGGAYKCAVEQHLPDAEIVFDRFHLVMNVNQAVDETRRSEWNKASKEDKKFIKGGRFLLLTNGSNLAENKQGKLQELLGANQALTTAYLLKEQFQAVYHYKSVGWAKRYLAQWCALALESGLKPFERLARGFSKSSHQIVSYVKHKITSGKIESFNNQIARIIHRSCGVVNLDYLFIRLRHATVMRNA
jgi:transposase